MTRVNTKISMLLAGVLALGGIALAQDRDRDRDRDHDSRRDRIQQDRHEDSRARDLRAQRERELRAQRERERIEAERRYRNNNGYNNAYRQPYYPNNNGYYPNNNGYYGNNNGYYGNNNGYYGRPGYGNGGYGSVAYNNGYSAGLQSGREDRAQGKSFDPQRHAHYRDGDSGYHSSYGPKSGYVNEYRSAWMRGYQQGYGGRF